MKSVYFVVLTPKSVFFVCPGVKMNKPGGVDAQGFFRSTNGHPPTDSAVSPAQADHPNKHAEPKPKSVWQRFKGLIIVLIVLFVVFLVVVVVMVVRRKKSGVSLPPGVKMTQSHAEDFSDKLQQFRDASEDIRKEISETHPDPTPLTSHRHN